MPGRASEKTKYASHSETEQGGEIHTETKKEFEDETQELRKTIPVEVSVELSVNDIFNWLTDCQNPAALRYLGKYALRCAEGLENPDDDDFRSRA